MPRADQDGDFGGEPAETRNAHRCRRRDHESERRERQRAVQLQDRQPIELARVRPPVNHASGDGKKERPDHPVRKHLQHRARNAEDICGSEAKKHKSHVTHARVTNDEFKVALAECDRCRIDYSDHSQNCHPFTPHLETLREKIHRHAQTTVRAQLHHNSGEQH